MGGPTDPELEAVLARFLQQYLEDQQQGGVGSLADYQQRFPGFEDAVAEEWRLLAEPDGPQRLPSMTASSRLLGMDLESGASGWLRRLQRQPEPDVAPELVGKGGMGEVYRVWDADLRRYVAKKVMRVAPGAESEAAVQRFVDEAQITGQLQHPGIVPVHQVGMDSEGRLFFTMDLVRGLSFREVIDRVHAQQDGWSLPRALGVVQRLCDAVGFAHSKGVLHRDLKPSNLMVGRFGEAYVMDWGLARILAREDARDQGARGAGGHLLSSVRTAGRERRDEDPESPLYTMDGDVVGTPAYMAPEQAEGDVARVGATADVYAIGAILYHLVCGRAPYVPASARVSSRALLARVIEGPPSPLRRQANVPESLLAIVERAMARDPAQRYATAEELGSDVQAYLDHRVVQAHRTGALAELTQWVGRNRLAAGALLVAGLAMALGLVWSSVERQRAESHAQAAAAAEAVAHRESESAVANFAVAMGAGTSLLDVVLSPELRGLPGGDRVLELFGATAETALRKAIGLHGSDPRVRVSRARASVRLGFLLGYVDRYDEAVAVLREGVQWFEEERGSPAWRAEDDTEALMARAYLGQFLYSSGAADEGLGALVDLLPRLRAEFTESQQISGDLSGAAFDTLGSVYETLGRAHYEMDRLDDAARYFQQAAIVVERELVHYPERDNGWELLTKCLLSRGKALRQLAAQGKADPTAAAVEWERGIELAETRLSTEPKDREVLHVVGEMRYALGTLFAESGDLPRARATLESAVEGLRALVADHMDHPSYCADLGGSLSNLGAVMGMLGDKAGGAERALEAIPVLRRGVKGGDDNALEYLKSASGVGATLLCETGAFGRAAALGRELAEDPPSLALLEFAAQILALVASMSEEPLDRADGYGAEAVRILGRALDAGFDPGVALGDGRYGNFHGRPGFDGLQRR